MSPRRAPRRFAALVLAVVVGLAATSCGSGASYVQNKEAETYFKVPKGWVSTRYNVDVTPPADYLKPGAWGVVLTPSTGDPAAVLEANVDQPGGVFIIGTLENEAYRSTTPAQLRVISLPTPDGQTEYLDPIDLLVTEDDRVQNLSLGTIASDGLHGYHLRYWLKPTLDSVPVVIDRLRLIHDATQTFYELRFVCVLQCFADNSREINAIIESLRIRRDQV